MTFLGGGWTQLCTTDFPAARILGSVSHTPGDDAKLIPAGHPGVWLPFRIPGSTGRRRTLPPFLSPPGRLSGTRSVIFLDAGVWGSVTHCHHNVVREGGEEFACAGLSWWWEQWPPAPWLGVLAREGGSHPIQTGLPGLPGTLKADVLGPPQGLLEEKQ